MKRKLKQKSNNRVKKQSKYAFFSIQRIVLLVAFIGGAGVNALILSQIQFLLLREIFSSIYVLIMPGFLLSWIIYPKYKNIWEVISYSLGLSIALLMLIGLGINWLLPIYHVVQPLSTLPVLLSLDTVATGLWLYLFARNISLPFEEIKITVSIKNILLGIVPVTFPLLSILGAISLNNHQTSIFTMLMLGLVACYVLLLTVLRDKVSEHIFTFTSLMTGAAILLMTSLRGWYITGHDIYLEYYVFQLTKQHNLWSMASYPNPYTACLSITILPTMLASITHMSDMYIFKILFQLVFSFYAVVTFLFLKKFINPFLAFLGTFIIVSLPTFMTDMPMLNRQEIALFFFVLLLLTLFNEKMSNTIKWFFFILLGIGLTLSHYSSTYITVGLFIGGALAYACLNILRVHPNIKRLTNLIDKKLSIEHNKANVKLTMVIVLLLATVAWNFSITHTADGIVATLNNITRDFTTKHFSKPKSDPASYSLLNVKKPTNAQLLTSYVTTFTQYVRKFNDETAFFPKEVYSQYAVSNGSQVKLPLTIIGRIMTSLHINVFSLNDALKQIYAKLIQVFIVIGFLSIFWYKKYVKNIKKEYLVLSVVFFGLLVVETVLPGSSIDYGILRLLQQGLILLVIPLMIGSLTIFSIFNKVHQSIKVYITSGIFIFFFLFLSGFIPQITGGYYGSLNLANSGFYYDAYYTHAEEIASINWLVSNKDKKTPIQSDWFTGKKIHTYSNVYSVDGLLPSSIRRNSYVYLSYSNVHSGEIIVYVNGAPIYYKFPMQFLDDNKNLIYNNGGTKIYR